MKTSFAVLAVVTLVGLAACQSETQLNEEPGEQISGEETTATGTSYHAGRDTSQTGELKARIEEEGVFAGGDVDRDGSLSREEFEEVLDRNHWLDELGEDVELGAEEHDEVRQENSRFEGWDTNDDGLLSEEEFYEGLGVIEENEFDQ